MYYPESAIIASENSHLAEVIQKVDRFLYERQGKAFYAGTAADALRIKLNDIQGILNLYKNAGVLTERKVWLCPKHGEEIDPVCDDVFHCPTCGRDYQANQCKPSVLYTARRIEGIDTNATSDAEQLSESPISVAKDDAIVSPINTHAQPTGDVIVAEATLNAASIQGKYAVIAAVIGVAGAIIIAVITIIANNNNNQIIQPSPLVTYTETATWTPTITIVPTETVDIRSLTVTATPSNILTETPSPNQP